MTNKTPVSDALSYLRLNSRVPLTKLSRQTQIPINDLYQFLHTWNPVVKRSTILLNFPAIGLPTTVLFNLSAHPHQWSAVSQMLVQSGCVNNLFRVIGDHDFVGEAAFESPKAAEKFFSALKEDFRNVSFEYHLVTDEICREQIFTSPYQGSYCSSFDLSRTIFFSS